MSTYGGHREPNAEMASHPNIAGHVVQAGVGGNFHYPNIKLWDLNLKDNVDSWSIPANMEMSFTDWENQYHGNLKTVWRGDATGKPRRHRGVNAVFSGPQRSFDQYAVRRAIPWKDYLVRCCSGTSGDRTNSETCGDYWQNQGLCDTVMTEFCTTDGDVPNVDKEAQCACINSPLYGDKYKDKMLPPPVCVDKKCSSTFAYKTKSDTDNLPCSMSIVDCTQQINLTDAEKADLSDINFNANCSAAPPAPPVLLPCGC